jgi:hypothetical protein
LPITAVKVRIDGGDWFNATDTSWNGTWRTWAVAWNSTTVPNGQHKISASAWDSSDQPDEKTVKVQVANPPWARIQSPADKTVAAGTVTIAGESGNPSAADAVKLVQVSIDPQFTSAVWQTATRTGADWGQWSFAWNTTGVVNAGWHVVAVRAFDGALYSEPWVNTYFLGDGPFAQIAYPNFTPPDTVSGIVPVHGMAGDRNPLELVTVRLDNGAWNNATDTSSNGSWSTWAYPWDSTQLSDGAHTLCARAWDGTLSSAAVCGPVNVNNNPPTVSIVGPADSATVRGLQLLYGYAGGTPSVQLVQVQFDGGAWPRAAGTGRTDVWSTWAFEWDTTKVPNGAHTVCARAFDGTLYSAPVCVAVNVQNGSTNHGTASQPLSETLLSMGIPSFFVGILASVVNAGYVPVLLVPGIVMIVIWLRSHNLLRG